MIYPTLEAAAESGYLAADKMDATLNANNPSGKDQNRDRNRGV